ncbi:MAG: hypothetical protein ACREVW_07695 [Burkholderiales bacterium]
MDEKVGQSVEARRGAMPVVAAFIDRMRAAYGREFVDGQLATAQQARRDHVRVLAEQGEAAAARWHKANADKCVFFAEEGGRSVGMPSPYGRTPHVGTPGTLGHTGNSTPSLAPVAGLGKSPAISPVSGE